MKNNIDENDVDKLIRLHNRSRYNEYQIRESEACGCFYCCRIYLTVNIIDEFQWCDESSVCKGRGRTAICPNCSIDSILTVDSTDSLTEELLQQMHGHWFTKIDVDEWLAQHLR